MTKEQVRVPAIRFKTKLHEPDAAAKTDSGALLTLPKAASQKLPSRGMTIVKGTVNGIHFRAVLQPDGQGSHWFRVTKILREAAGIAAGDTVALEIEPAKVWPEPTLTADVKSALAADPEARAVWTDITPMARWDWLNWMDSVKLSKTRQERPEKLCSMLRAGKRRPCCFNRALRMAPQSAELL